MLKIKSASFAATIILMFASAIPAQAQTIDDLTDAARQKRMNELTKSINPQSNTTTNVASRELVLLAIYGIEKSLVCELSEDGITAKYRVGDKLPSGWTVATIQQRTVTLKNGKSTKNLSFWSPTEIDHSNMPLNVTSPSGMTPFPTGR